MMTKSRKRTIGMAESIARTLLEESGGGSWTPGVDELVDYMVENEFDDDEVSGWLKDQGITDEKEIHEIYKEFKRREREERAFKSVYDDDEDASTTPSDSPAWPEDSKDADLDACDALLEDIFMWYRMDAEVFIPVEVKTGRKFRGFGYILSFKPVHGKYMGSSFEALVYKVWDPKNLCFNEFNTNMINIFEDGRYKSRWNTAVEVDDTKMLNDFKDYFASVVRHAKDRCGTDYKHMKNYFAACTRFDYDGRARAGMPEELIDQVIDAIKRGVA